MGNALLAEQNIFGGVKYLAGLLKQYGGNVALATAAYNAGAGAVQKHGGIPLMLRLVPMWSGCNCCASATRTC